MSNRIGRRIAEILIWLAFLVITISVIAIVGAVAIRLVTMILGVML